MSVPKDCRACQMLRESFGKQAQCWKCVLVWPWGPR